MLEYLNSIGLGYSDNSTQEIPFKQTISLNNESQEITFFDDKPKIKTYIFIHEFFYKFVYEYFKNKNKTIIIITSEMHNNSENEYYNSQSIALTDTPDSNIPNESLEESFLSKNKYNKQVSSYLAKELIKQINTYKNNLSDCYLLLFDSFKYPIIDDLLIKINSQYSFDLNYVMIKNSYFIIHNNNTNNLYCDIRKTYSNFFRKIKVTEEHGSKIIMRMNYKIFEILITTYFSQYFTSKDSITLYCKNLFKKNNFDLDANFGTIPIDKSFSMAKLTILYSLSEANFE